MDLSKQRRIISCLLLVLGLVLSGCASGNTSSGNSDFLQPPNFTVTPNQGLVAAGQSVQFSTSGSSGSLVNLTWKVNGVAGGSTSTGNITASGVYTAPATVPKNSVSITATNSISNETTVPAQVSFWSPGNLAGGTVSTSANPLVALYNVTAPIGSKVQVQFGTSTSYGLSTSQVPAPTAGGSVGILVAGMRAGTTYHMQATTRLASGQQFVDADHTFTTGVIPASLIPAMTVVQPASSNTGKRGKMGKNFFNIAATSLQKTRRDVKLDFRA